MIKKLLCGTMLLTHMACATWVPILDNSWSSEWKGKTAALIALLTQNQNQNQSERLNITDTSYFSLNDQRILGIQVDNAKNPVQVDLQDPQTLRTKILGELMNKNPNTPMVQILCDTAAYTEQGTQKMLQAFQSLDLRHYVVEFGVTGNKSSDNKQLSGNAMVHQLLEEGILKPNQVLANLVGKSFEWPCFVSDNIHNIVLTYNNKEIDNQTNFGDDVKISDDIMDGAKGDLVFLFEGGAQSFEQAINVLGKNVPVIAFTRPINAHDAWRETNQQGRFSAAAFLNILKGQNLIGTDQDDISQKLTTYFNEYKTSVSNAHNGSFSSAETHLAALAALIARNPQVLDLIHVNPTPNAIKQIENAQQAVAAVHHAYTAVSRGDDYNHHHGRIATILVHNPLDTYATDAQRLVVFKAIAQISLLNADTLEQLMTGFLQKIKELEPQNHPNSASSKEIQHYKTLIAFIKYMSSRGQGQAVSDVTDQRLISLFAKALEEAQHENSHHLIGHDGDSGVGSGGGGVSIGGVGGGVRGGAGAGGGGVRGGAGAGGGGRSGGRSKSTTAPPPPPPSSSSSSSSLRNGGAGGAGDGGSGSSLANLWEYHQPGDGSRVGGGGGSVGRGRGRGAGGKGDSDSGGGGVRGGGGRSVFSAVLSNPPLTNN